MVNSVRIQKTAMTWRWPGILAVAAIAMLLATMLACKSEKLAPTVCRSGTFECVDGGRGRICNPLGTGWSNTSCGEGRVCVPGNCDAPELCPAGCKEQLCNPGERVCGKDRLYVYQCDDTGTARCFSHSCGEAPFDGVCFSGECVSTCAAEQKSYLGCEYFAVDLDNANVPCGRDILGNMRYCDAAASQFAVVVSNPDPTRSAFVVVSKGELETPQAGADDDMAGDSACFNPPLPDNFVDARVIPPKGIEVIELPRRDANGTVLKQLAYRLATNIPVTAYQFNPLENEDVFSNDASLLLPTTTAGTDYLVMTREQSFGDLKGFVTVIGVDDEPTEVTVAVTAKTLPGEELPGMVAGDSLTATLERFDVLNIETNQIGADLTGSEVSSDRPVVVFAGSEASNAPNTSRCDVEAGVCEFDRSRSCGCDEVSDSSCSPHAACATASLITCCADHLEQQMYPLSAWGRHYLAVRSFPRGQERDVWRIMAGEDGTEVTLSPPVALVPPLDRGQWFEFESNDDFEISSESPLLVGQFLAAEHAPGPGVQTGDAGIGDPAFVLIAPTAQLRESYVFLAPDKYELDYVSIALRRGDDVLLDGRSVETLGGALVREIGDSGWVAVSAPLSDGFHTLGCSETCSVMVHGYDQFVSYGYPGGLNLDDL